MRRRKSYSSITILACLLAISTVWLSTTWCPIACAEDAVENATLVRWLQRLSDRSPAYRAQAAFQLAKLGSDAAPAVDALYERLNDPSPDVRLGSAHALGYIMARPTETLMQLIPVLDDPDEHVRYAAEWAIARIALEPLSEQAAIERLDGFRDTVRTMLTRDHHQRHRMVIEEVIAALSKFEPAPEVQSPPKKSDLELEIEARLAALVRLEKDFELSGVMGQLRIIKQLGSVRDELLLPTAHSVRRKILKQSILRAEQTSFHFALKHWGSDGQLAIMDLFDELPLNQKLPEWTSQIIVRVAPRHHEDVLRLISIAEDRVNTPAVRSSAFGALGSSRLDVEACAASLVAIAVDQSEDSVLRSQAIASAGQLSEGKSIGANVESRFLDILRDPRESWKVQVATAMALSRINPLSAPAADAFLATANEKMLHNSEVISVLEVIAQFGSTAAAGKPFIARALKSDDDLVRLAAARGAAMLGPSAADLAPLLLSRLGDSAETMLVREEAIKALASIGPDAIAATGKELCESEDYCRVSGLNALAMLGEDAAPALDWCIRILEDDYAPSSVRSAAAFVIGQMGQSGRRGSDAIRHWLQADSHPTAQATAVVSLAEVGSVQETETQSPNPTSDVTATRVAFAFADHMMGDSFAAQRLVQLLDTDQPQYAVAALQDLGESAAQPLLSVIKRPSTAPDLRSKALEVLGSIPQISYQPLLELLGDPNMGPACQHCLSTLSNAGNGEQLLTDLVSLLDANFGPQADARMESLAESLVVTASSEQHVVRHNTGYLLSKTLQSDFDWRETHREPPGDTSGSEPIAITDTPTSRLSFEERSELLDTSTDSLAFSDIPSSMLADDLAPPAAAVLPSVAAPSRESSSPGRRVSPEIPSMELSDSNLPQTENWKTLPQQLSDSPSASASASASSVTVFYGTNRAPYSSSTTLSHSRPAMETVQKLLAVLASIVIIAIWIVGFLRRKVLLYSVLALASVVLLANWLGVRNLRIEVPMDKTELAYGSEFSDELAMGTCEVSIPKNHVPGELETPQFFKFEFSEDEEKHIVVKKTLPMEQGDFYDRMHQELESKGDSLLVFVHGYNVSFADAAKRTAQMSHDLSFRGAPVFYSWPSKDNWYEYQQDRKNIQLSVGHIKRFLLQLAEKSGAREIHLVAHSMGNIGLTEALAEIENPNRRPLFNQVVLAAPDIDADLFKSRIAPKILGKADRFTVYTSSTDLALVASRYFNSGNRAGETGGDQNYEGIDVIDASAVDTSLLGHSYYGSLSVLGDVGELLLDRPLTQRSYVKTALVNGQPYWYVDSPYVVNQRPAGRGVLR